MTERITDPDEIRDIAEQIMGEHGELAVDELVSEFRVHDLEVRRDDLEAAMQ